MSHDTCPTLGRLALTDRDVHNFPVSLGKNLDTLGVPFNEIMGSGLIKLMMRASELVSLDLEGNAIEFDPRSQGVDLLWRERSHLHHLNVSCNNFAIQSFIRFFWRDGRSKLETLDASTPTQD